MALSAQRPAVLRPAVRLQAGADLCPGCPACPRLTGPGFVPPVTRCSSLYSSSTLRVNVAGRAGLPQPSRTGLKQGCPLSPTLFGLFADG